MPRRFAAPQALRLGPIRTYKLRRLRLRGTGLSSPDVSPIFLSHSPPSQLDISSAFPIMPVRLKLRRLKTESTERF